MSTVKGDAFRDQIALLLKAAGYLNVVTERMISGKKVDVYAERQYGFLTQRIGFEAKDYRESVPISQATAFTYDYGSLREQGEIDQGVLVSHGILSSASMLHLDKARNRGLIGITYEVFQRGVFGPDDYLRALIEECENEGLNRYYIPARIEGGPLSSRVDAWMADSAAKPLVVLGDYGSGKSTFALRLASDMARRSLEDPTARIPVRVPLGHLVDENSLAGLFGKLFTDTYRVEAYRWPLFVRLNQLGRFLIILDGFDEMKHGMTYSSFQHQFDRLLSLADGDARVLILGRDTAFANDREFLAIVEGRDTTASGTEIRFVDRPACERVKLTPFTLAEARSFVRGYFPLLAEREGLSADDPWVGDRIESLLSGRYDELLVRPVHGQILCQIASDPRAHSQNRTNSICTNGSFTIFSGAR